MEMPNTYPCTICNEGFITKSNRDNHFRRICQSFVNLIDINGNIKTIERIDGKFKCVTCGARYNRSDNLTNDWKKCQTKDGSKSNNLNSLIF